MPKYSDYGSLSSRYVEEIAYSRSIEEARQAFAFPASLPEKATLQAALAELIVATSSVQVVAENVLAHGAKGDGSTDDTIAIQAAVTAAASSHGIVVFPRPSASYRISGTIVLPAARMALVGLDPGLTVTIYHRPTANNQPAFRYLNGDNVRFVNLDVNLDNTGGFTGITAFDLGNASVSAVWFERVFVTGFNAYGILLDSAQYLKVDGCRFLGQRSHNATPAEGIRCNTFLNSASITRCRFGENDKDMRIAGSATGVSIRSCSFERSGNTSDGLYPVNAATIDRMIEIEGALGLEWSGNYVEAPVPGGTNGFLYLLNCAGYRIGTTIFSGEWGGVGVTPRMINVSGGRAGRIECNRFDQIINAFIRVDASSDVISVHNNAFKDAGVELTSYNSVMALMDGAAVTRIELNNFGVESNYDPASLADGDGVTAPAAPVPISNLEFGDTVDVTFDKDMQGVLLVGYVESAGNARCRFQNESGGVVDLASGTLRFAPRKRKS